MEEIIPFFEDATVFLTGATGFLGQVLLSKLISSCPNIRKIYVLIREKKNRSINERIQEIFDTPIFAKLKRECPQYIHKITAINGDCLRLNLGISEQDRLILENTVNIIFHAAATVTFVSPLRDAVNVNVRSTSDLLDMAKNMTELKAFVHVSTSYSFCAERTLIEEKFYKPPISAEELIKTVDQLSDHEIEEITPKLLGQYPNTYVYTKAVAESLFTYKGTEIPISIFRPGIVLSTAKEPVPGWINNIYGPTGILVAACSGLMRTMQTDKDCKANIVPCDYVINALISSAWYTAKMRRKLIKTTENGKNRRAEQRFIPVFNYSSTESKNALTWEKIVKYISLHERQYPYSSSIWIFGLTLHKCKFTNQLYELFLHLIPAVIFDKLASVCGKELKLCKSYQKLHTLSSVLSYFSTRNWTIRNDNVQELWNLLSEQDKLTFDFNLDNIEWKDYFKHYYIGMRVYVGKDDMDTVPYAIKRRKKLIIIYYTTLIILFLLFAYFFYALCGMFF